MQSVVALAVLAVAAVVNAQQAAPPACATNCVATTQTSCSQSDISCLCHDTSFISAATQCILTTCQGSDIQAAEVFAQQLCATVGVTLTSTPALPSSTGSGSTSASGSASGSAPSGSQTAPPTQSSGASGSAGSSTGASPTSGTAPATTTTPGAATTLEAGFTGLFGALVALFVL